MYFSAAASSENDQGNMNLASKTAPVPSTMPSSVASHPWNCASASRAAGHREWWPRVALIPGAVELFGDVSELHDKIAGQVLRAPFLRAFPATGGPGPLRRCP